MSNNPNVPKPSELSLPPAPQLVEDALDTHPPRPAQPNRAPHKSQTQIAAEVHAGWWGDVNGREDRLTAAGFDAKTILDLVEKGVGKTAAETLGNPPKQNLSNG